MRVTTRTGTFDDIPAPESPRGPDATTRRAIDREPDEVWPITNFIACTYPPALAAFGGLPGLAAGALLAGGMTTLACASSYIGNLRLERVHRPKYPGNAKAAEDLCKWLKRRNILDAHEMMGAHLSFTELETTYRLRAEKDFKWMTPQVLRRVVVALNTYRHTQQLYGCTSVTQRLKDTLPPGEYL
jgi:hypothetical protein